MSTHLPVALESVRGLHLGRCARRILLLAPRPEDEPSVLPAERDGRASSESHRRAMRRLAANGLIELSTKVVQVQTTREKQNNRVSWDGNRGVYREVQEEHIPIRRHVEKRAARLTPLGALVVDRLRPALETGTRIRWESIMNATDN